MLKHPIFSLEDSSMALPWRDYTFATKHILVVTAVLVSVVILSGIIDGIKPAKFLIAAGICAILVPALLYFARYWHTQGPFTTPLLVTKSGIIAPTIFYKSHIPWSDVARVEHIWSLMGPNMTPIENNLIIHKKSGRSKRLFIPELTPDEKDLFFTILRDLSVENRFELIID